MRTLPLLADFTHTRTCKPFCEKFLTLPIGNGGEGNLAAGIPVYLLSASKITPPDSVACCAV